LEGCDIMTKTASLIATSLVLAGLLFSPQSLAETSTFAPVSGVDNTEGDAASLTASDISRLTSSDDSRMASNVAWPGTGSYDETKYIEFAFTPSIPVDAIISAVSITHEYRRNAILVGAKLEVWDGSMWHDISIEVPSANATDISETKDIIALVSTPTALNSLAVRFLAYRDTPAVSATTSHDLIELSVSYSLPATPTPTPSPTATPTPSPSPIPSITPTPTPATTPSPSYSTDLGPTKTPTPPAIVTTPTPEPKATPNPVPVSSISPSPAISVTPKSISKSKKAAIKSTPAPIETTLVTFGEQKERPRILTWLNKNVLSKLTAALSLLIRF